MPYITVGQEKTCKTLIYLLRRSGNRATRCTSDSWISTGMDIPGRSRSLVLLNEGYWVITYAVDLATPSPTPPQDYDTFAADLNTLMTSLTCKIPCVSCFSLGQVKLRTLHTRTVQKAVLMAPVPPFLLKTNDNPEGVDQSVPMAL